MMMEHLDSLCHEFGVARGAALRDQRLPFRRDHAADLVVDRARFLNWLGVLGAAPAELRTEASRRRAEAADPRKAAAVRRARDAAAALRPTLERHARLLGRLRAEAAQQKGAQ